MKKILYIILLATCLSTGCEKALEEEAYSSIYTKDFYSNGQEAEAALNAVYGSMVSLYDGAVIWAPEWSSDIMFPRNVVGRGTITNFQYEPSYAAQAGAGRVQESPQQIWVSGYRAIDAANWVIEKVPTTPMTAERRDQIVGEAYFLRAFFHWILTKNFGNIVIKTNATASLEAAYVGTSPIKDVYKQIDKDLAMAETMLPEYTAQTANPNTPFTAAGRITREGAQLLRAKAALYDENWALALQKAKDVMASGKYSLIPYADIFDVFKEQGMRREVLFSVEINATTNPQIFSQIHYFCAPGGAVEYNRGGAGAMYVFMRFYNTFNPLDKRRELLATNFKNATGGTVIQRNIDSRLASRDSLVILGKYKDPTTVSAGGNTNIMILRYADAFLIAAEAEFRLNGATTAAYGFINAVRTRAQVPALTTGLNLDVILRERAWEFFGEGDRWYDLTRTGKFLTEVPKYINLDYPARAPQPKHKYFPIPQIEILANPKLQQNEAWR